MNRNPMFTRRYLLLNFAVDQNASNAVADATSCCWEQRPFAVEGIEHPQLGGLGSGCKSMELRRLRSVQHGATHPFIDVNFVEATNEKDNNNGILLHLLKRQSSSSSTSSSHLAQQQGLFEELQSVEWRETPMELGGDTDDEEEEELDERKAEEGKGTTRRTWTGQSSSSWGEYSVGRAGSNTSDERLEEEEEPDRNLGHILIAYETQQNMAPQFGPFLVDWHNWCAVRELCELLPSKCTFRRVSFYRRQRGINEGLASESCRFSFLLLLEVENALVERASVLNCINNAQSMCFNRAYIGLYEEIEFEIELDTLQHLVAAGRSINCPGNRLIIQFGQKEIANEKPPLPFACWPPAQSNNSCSSSAAASFYSEPTCVGASEGKISSSRFAGAGNDHNDNNSFGASAASEEEGIFYHFLPKSGTAGSDWRWDAEMEEIGVIQQQMPGGAEDYGENGIVEDAEEKADENQNVPRKGGLSVAIDIGQSACDQSRHKSSLNNNTTTAPARRKSSWRFIKSLFSSGTSSASKTVAQPIEHFQMSSITITTTRRRQDQRNGNESAETTTSSAAWNWDGRQQNAAAEFNEQTDGNGPVAAAAVNGRKKQESCAGNNKNNNFLLSFWRKISLK